MERAIAIFSPDTDCMIAETSGIFMVIAEVSPFLNFTSGVRKSTLVGMHFSEE